MSRSARTRFVVAAVLAAVTAVSACSIGETSETAGRDAVVVGIDAAVSTLDPAATNSIGTDLSVIGSIYSSLVYRAPDLTLQPNLATEWTQVDPLTWEFELDPDAVFTDGTPVDATAVAWNFDRLLAPDASFRQASAFASLERAEVVDPDTLRLHTEYPDFQIPQSLTSLFMLSPAWTESHSTATEAMGSGPYELVSFGGGEEVVLRAKADYWGEQPAIADVTFRAVPDPAARLAALTAGEIDVTTGLSPDDVPVVEAGGGLQVTSTESTGVTFVKFNTLQEPFDDVRIRQALNYAIDKQAIITALLGDLTTPSPGQVVTPGYAGYADGVTGYDHDPDRARQLLAEAGYDGSVPIEMTVPTGTYMQSDRVAQAIVAQLAEVGVAVNLQSLPFSVYMDRYLTEQDMAPLNYIRQGARSITVGGAYSTLFVSDSAYAYWDDAEFTGLVENAFAAPDEAARNDLLATAAQRLRDEAPVLFLFAEPTIGASREGLTWQGRQDSWVLPREMSWS